MFLESLGLPERDFNFQNKFKPSPMPSDQCLWFDDDQS